MGYVCLIIIAIIFSFGGMLVHGAALMVNSYWISCCRFLVGSLFLVVYMAITKKKIQVKYLCWPVVGGAVLKSINYLTENYGLAHGYSYGNIIIWPMQCMVALLLAVLVFHEKTGWKGILGSILCVGGIGVISLNGQPLSVFMQDGLLFLILYSVAGAAAAGFMVMQKLLLRKMNAENTNLSMFSLAILVTAVPLPFVGETTGEFHFLSLICLILFGLVTGVGFLLNAYAMKTVPLYMITIIQSSTVIFSLLWGVLFMHEPVTRYILLGTAIFVVGMLIINVRLPKRQTEANKNKKEIGEK